MMKNLPKIIISIGWSIAVVVFSIGQLITLGETFTCIILCAILFYLKTDK